MGIEGQLKEEAKGQFSGGVDAVDRALAILATFDVGRERQTLGDLATRTGLYKSTILRLARSLEVAGYLYREEGGVFMLGAEPSRLAAVYRRVPGLESRVRPILQALRDETGESASFFRREGHRRQCLYREETRRAIRDQLMEGDMLPLNLDASGRVLTAFGDPLLSASERTRLYAQLPFACFGESDPETAALAAPVFSSEGLAGALSVSGPRTRLTPERIPEIGPLIVSKAETLSTLLGAASPLTTANRVQKTAEL